MSSQARPFSNDYSPLLSYTNARPPTSSVSSHLPAGARPTHFPSNSESYSYLEPKESRNSDYNVSTVEVHKVAKSWVDATVPWYLTFALTLIAYILVVIIAFFVSYRGRYDTIVNAVSWDNLVANGNKVDFPILAIAADGTSGTKLAFDVPQYKLQLLKGSPANPVVVPGTDACSTIPIEQDRVGNYSVGIFNVSRAGPACSITDQSTYLWLSIPYNRTSSAFPPCLLVGLYHPSTNGSAIVEKLGDVETAASLRFVPGESRVYVSAAPTRLIRQDGTEEKDYDLTLDFIPQPLEVAPTSPAGGYGMIPTPEQPVLNVYIKYSKLLQVTTQQKRAMNKTDIFFAAISLWAAPSAVFTALSLLGTGWIQRKKARIAGI